MRFLMNTLVALISTAVDSCVPNKLSLDALGLSCRRVSEACLTIIRAYRQGHIEQLSVFRHSLKSRFSKLLLRDSPIRKLSSPKSTPLLQGTFPIL